MAKWYSHSPTDQHQQLKIQSYEFLGKDFTQFKICLKAAEKNRKYFRTDFRVQERNTWLGRSSCKGPLTPESCPHELTQNPAVPLKEESYWLGILRKLDFLGRQKQFSLYSHILPDYSSQTKVCNHFIVMLSF